MTKTKVFVGNLSFKIREDDLAQSFIEAGKVSGANIITRQGRSLGYGFVEMETLEEAQKAVELFNKKEIDGRAVNVEIARIREEGGEGSAQPRQPRPPRGPPRGDRDNNSRGPPRGGFRRRGPPRGGPRRGPGGPPQDGGAPIPAQQGQIQQGQDQPRPPRRPFFRRGPPGGGNPGQQQQQGGDRSFGGDRPFRPRGPRLPRQPRPDQGPRTPSATTLFVANLPFSIDDQGLSGLFQGFNVKSAHVVTKRNARSKGFGFVEFNTEDDQKAALAKLDNTEVEGRQLIVKVALAEAPVAQQSGEAVPESK